MLQVGKGGGESFGNPPGWSDYNSVDISVDLTNETTDSHGSLGISFNSYNYPWYLPSGPMAALVQDHLYIHDSFAGDRVRIRMDISGLVALRDYRMTSWHNSGYNHLSAPGKIDIYVGAVSVVNDLQQTLGVANSDDAAKADFVFTADASGNVTISFESTELSSGPEAWPTNGECVVINGFELMDPGDPRAPSPSDAEPNQCPDLLLTWEPGDYADTHDVYLGTDQTAVENATTATAGIYRGNYEPNEFDTTPLSLQLGETYYWRIDEVSSTVAPYLWKGPVWSFTLNDGYAHDPNPEQGLRLPPDNVTLTWTPGCLATSHDVYVGTDYADVDAATSSVHPNVDYNNVDSPSHTPSLDPFTTYYWRVDEVDGGTFKGDTWTFKTGLGGLIMYYKFNGTQGNDLPSTVIDDSGNNIAFTKYTADSGSVKYGQSNPIVAESTASAELTPLAGLLRDDTGEHDPLRLDGTEYTIEMWINTQRISDDYGDPRLIGKRGAGSWRLGLDHADSDRPNYYWGHAGRGRETIRGSATDDEGEWVHIAVVFDRDSSDGITRKMYHNGEWDQDEGAVGRELEPNPADANGVGIGMQEGWYDGEGVWHDPGSYYDGLIDELRIHDIALTPCAFLLTPGPEYASCPIPEDGQYDVDPNLVLGWLPGSGATSHNVYLGQSYDDVNNATTDTAGIYRGNVTVSHFPESGMLELQTARTYYWRVDEVNGGVYKGPIWSFDTIAVVVDPNIRAWYKLDEESGTTVRDYSGRAYHADIIAHGGGPFWDPDDGRFGGSLGFDGTDVRCPLGVLGTIETTISVSVWLKDAYDAYEPGSDNWVFSSLEGDGSIVQAAVVEDSTGQVLWRAGDNSMDVLRWNLTGADRLEGWHHWVFIKDEGADTMSIYFDGIVAKSKDTEDDDVNDTLVNIQGSELRLGANESSTYNFVGSMDDFRLYDKVLSTTEVQALFRGGDVASAWAPQPYDGQSDVARNTQLIWKPGDYAQFHDVYLGTSFDDVNDGTTSSGVYKDRLAVEVNYYEPTPVLGLETTYYWRIDEVNTTDPNTWRGKVWSFTVADFLIVDDMESYSAIPLSGNEIYDTWDDGFMNWTGAQVSLEYGSAMVHGGDQAMKLVYDSSIGFFKFSEIDANTTGPRPGNLDVGVDWTSAGVRALTLFFYGQSTNDSDQQMYVALEDGSSIVIAEYGDLGEDMNDIKQQEWRQWDIPMTAFSGNGLTTTNVTKVRIGFGDRDNPAAGGSGIVFFDDIRLYRPKCVPWLLKPAADFTDDCVVDFDDVGTMGEQWLRTDAYLSTEAPAAGPVAYWDFEEGNGSTVGDSINNYDGTAEGDYSWVAGRIGTYAMEFDGGWVSVPDDGNTPLLRLEGDRMSVTAWVTISEHTSGWTFLVLKGRDNYETFGLEINPYDGLTYFVRDANASIYDVDGQSALTEGEWLHIAGTYDGENLTGWLNGQLEMTEAIGSIELYSDPNDGLGMAGRWNDNGGRFVGSLDEVRVYDYGLLAEEVAHIATDGSGYSALLSQVNLYNKETPGARAINLLDFAVLADEWLVEELWP
ncbi:MAG: LamG-like jellyroll fold domain-containing protein [Planctomycetota bacterium]|jgi:hypothetical protein